MAENRSLWNVEQIQFCRFLKTVYLQCTYSVFKVYLQCIYSDLSEIYAAIILKLLLLYVVFNNISLIAV